MTLFDLPVTGGDARSYEKARPNRTGAEIPARTASPVGLKKVKQLSIFGLANDYPIADDELRKYGHFAAGEALQPAETAMTLYWKNGKVAVTDGPYAETKEQLGGILVLEARDLNHAIQLMSQHPGVKNGPFEVRPAADLNGMVKESEQRRRKDIAR
jgi:hypothetical protein